MDQKAQANKTGIGFMIFILIFLENCLYYRCFFSVWLRTSSTPTDINLFWSHTANQCHRIIFEGNLLKNCPLFQKLLLYCIINMIHFIMPRMFTWAKRIRGLMSFPYPPNCWLYMQTNLCLCALRRKKWKNVYIAKKLKNSKLGKHIFKSEASTIIL